MKNFRLPIVTKLVLLSSVLIIGVAGVIAWNNTNLFTQISKGREEATAESLTKSKSHEVEALLQSYVDKLSLLAQDRSSNSLNGDILYFELESINGRDNKFLTSLNADATQSETYKSILQNFYPHSETLKGGKTFIANSGTLAKLPYLVIGAPVVESKDEVTHWAWAIFKLDRLQSSFADSSLMKTYLLDSTGKVLVHPDESFTLEAKDFSTSPIVESLLTEKIRNRQQYRDEVLYSTSKTLYGPVVVAEVTLSQIMAPAKLAQDMSTFLLGLILSTSFFFIVFFAHSISKNLEKLTFFSREIAQGNFDIEASKEIRSKDEIGTLAIAFDEMTSGLKERDKIKNIFTKFHGTSITETLLEEDDLRKGKKCDAVVFFSDIRGFTDFSNHKSPEEVVTMLNSYFQVMVGIITKHGGVVDKFVGDAIMAIWGAPHSTGDDARNALYACLEMREALAVFNDDRIAKGQEPIRMGMGLHAGPVVAGTVGSNERMEYTVIGDTVNTASRIESSTKSFGTDLLISESVAKQIEDEFLLEPAGSTKVKGKTDALKLAKVRGFYQDGEAVEVETEYSSYKAESSEKIKIVA
jgi:adenylate cyclase